MKLRFVLRCVPVVPLLLALTCGASGCNSAPTSSTPLPPPGQAAFATPDAAFESLVSALRARDTGRLYEILGPAAEDILSSGDEVADRADAERFLALYDQEHQVGPGSGGVHTLFVGTEAWAFPVPIVRSQAGYVFDSESGRDEILTRRIGRNELDAAQVCLAIVDAQREYVEARPMGGNLPEYASKLVSGPGRKDGLYWPTAEGEAPSPLGPLMAAATAEGYGPVGSAAATAAANVPTPAPGPYHGYRYRLLTSQGPNAQGGALSYLINDRLIGGFAVVAYPAEYGNSGIMTFITNHDGVVYQRDLGPETEKAAKAMAEFDPGPGWSRTTDESQPAQP